MRSVRHFVVRRRSAVAVVLGGALVLLAQPIASADVLSNVGPASQVPGGSLMEAYPLGNYTLDHHFSAVDAGVFSGVDVSGIAPTMAWFLASVIWLLTAFLAHAAITLFTFAFSLDLVNGGGTAGGAGALEPVSEAVRSIYRTVFGEAWLVVAITVTGLWAIWHALVRRRYTETAGALGLSVVFVVIALAFVTQPERTIGEASRWTNAMSGAFLSLSSEGNVTDQSRAKRQAADRLFSLLIFEPWVVLQFGGREHCVSADDGDDPDSVPVRPLARDPRQDAALSRRLARSQEIRAGNKVCVNAANKYAPRFLEHGPGSEERDDHHEALKDGDTSKAPEDDRDGYRLGPADKPAAEAMGKDGQYQRLLLAIVVFAGQLGAILLLGALSVAVILAQVLTLLLLAFAPIALVIGVFPGRGHDFFRGWLTKLAAFLVRKAAYSLILAVLLAVVAAVGDATSSLGWLMGWGLQGAFFWSVLIWRKQLLGQLTRATTGQSSDSGGGAGRFASGYAVAHAAGRFWNRHRPARGHTPPPRSRPGGPAAPVADAPAAVAVAPMADRTTSPAEPGETPQQTPTRPPQAASSSAPAEGATPAARTQVGSDVAEPPDRQSPPDAARADGGDRTQAQPDAPVEPTASGGPAESERPLARALHEDRQRLHGPPPDTGTPPEPPALPTAPRHEDIDGASGTRPKTGGERP
jgi:hypothetical protein